jgi:hypothetical protein
VPWPTRRARTASPPVNARRDGAAAADQSRRRRGARGTCPGRGARPARRVQAAARGVERRPTDPTPPAPFHAGRGAPGGDNLLGVAAVRRRDLALAGLPVAAAPETAAGTRLGQTSPTAGCSRRLLGPGQQLLTSRSAPFPGSAPSHGFSLGGCGRGGAGRGLGGDGRGLGGAGTAESMGASCTPEEPPRAGRRSSRHPS